VKLRQWDLPSNYSTQSVHHQSFSHRKLQNVILPRDAHSDLSLWHSLTSFDVLQYNNKCYIRGVNGTQLKEARLVAACTQQAAATKLGVTQAYLSMVERGNRPVSTELASKAVQLFEVPATALPLDDFQSGSRDGSFFASALGALGYSGFSHLRGAARTNPTALLMDALDCDNLDSRVTEGLPWIPVAYPELDWDWLTRNARLHDRQNRLAFIVTLASQVAEKKGSAFLANTLSVRVHTLEASRLAAEGTLCRESMTQAERKWLRTHRSSTAKHWNLLTDLTVNHLDHALLDHGLQ
jgi:transcriptional regulator with XRE-family HTH domain